MSSKIIRAQYPCLSSTAIVYYYCLKSRVHYSPAVRQSDGGNTSDAVDSYSETINPDQGSILSLAHGGTNRDRILRNILVQPHHIYAPPSCNLDPENLLLSAANACQSTSLKSLSTPSSHISGLYPISAMLNCSDKSLYDHLSCIYMHILVKSYRILLLCKQSFLFAQLLFHRISSNCCQTCTQCPRCLFK